MVEPALMERTADALLAVVVEQDMPLDKVRQNEPSTVATAEGPRGPRGVGQSVCFVTLIGAVARCCASPLSSAMLAVLLEETSEACASVRALCHLDRFWVQAGPVSFSPYAFLCV